jgi:outer membrane beta-barrel protein
MESWRKRVFLTAVTAACCPAIGWTAEEPTAIEVINPDFERREIRPASIDTENFEVGGFVGMLSIADFDSELLYGLRAAWHITEDFFLEANYGASEADLTSYEKLSGGTPLFDDGERDYSFYDLNLGWNVMPGEIFMFGRAFKSDLYLVGGAGATDFLGDSWFTVTLGGGYRLLLNDWISWRVDARDHIFDRDVFGEEETTHNIELSTGITFFF